MQKKAHTAREELERNAEDFWGIKQFHLGGTHREIVVGLLGRIKELEQERDAALERVRVLEAQP